jgi:hypoxanthine phosphoribosyltransferase
MTRGPAPAFAHASEAEMSRILDFYGVRWSYEPHTFPILWNLDGDVVESFSPDFYLQDLDLYLEMTTLRQKLVRKKNRKLRRLRELYPDIRIKLFYARDFRALMLKYGKLALADALSGTAGQVTVRAVVPEPEPEPVDALDVGTVPIFAPVATSAADGLQQDPDLAAVGASSSTTARRRRRRRQAALGRAAERRRLSPRLNLTAPLASTSSEGPSITT